MIIPADTSVIINVRLIDSNIYAISIYQLIYVNAMNTILVIILNYTRMHIIILTILNILNCIKTTHVI